MGNRRRALETRRSNRKKGTVPEAKAKKRWHRVRRSSVSSSVSVRLQLHFARCSRSTKWGTTADDQTDSYSDLSDLDVFSSSEGGDESADHHQQQQQRKKNAHEDGGGVKATGEEKKKKKRHNHRQQQQHSLDTFITAAFAHRDLTPPELALGYALRQHCRNDTANKRYYVFPRAGRVFERLDG
uniref:Uncharacterized protein n=1 Tax=Globodera rostochiensis TaxID=31243 RepID=A0A914H032_GLORO